jgi:broad specificity phosphatase PhoE
LPPPRLLFIRHGETDWNAVGRLQGQQDIPLNELGRRQAAEAGRHLRRLVPDPAALPWIVSPLERTRHTAELARRALGLPEQDYALDERIKELSFGRWEGLTWREVRKSEPGSARAREADKWAFVPPGGESYAMLADRVSPWFNGLEREAVVVSHGGVARALLHLVTGMPSVEAPSEDIWQGRVLIIEPGRHAWS